MTEREKMLLHSKYGHSKILFLIHLVGGILRSYIVLILQLGSR